MPQSLAKLLVHIVFSTKDRINLIDPAIEDNLYRYISGIVNKNNARLFIANGTENHSHFLVSLPSKIDLPVLIGDMKRSSSVWIKEQDPRYRKFSWQRGYGAFSIGQSQKDTVVEYIRNQKIHHRRQSFEDEYRELLKRYEVDFDERYVWD